MKRVADALCALNCLRADYVNELYYLIMDMQSVLEGNTELDKDLILESFGRNIVEGIKAPEVLTASIA